MLKLTYHLTFGFNFNFDFFYPHQMDTVEMGHAVVYLALYPTRRDTQMSSQYRPVFLVRNELLNGKTNDVGFPPGPTQTSLYSHRSRLEA